MTSYVNLRLDLSSLLYKVDMGKKTTDEIVDWLEEFQQRSDELCGSNSLVFTMEIWNPESPPDEVPRNKKVTICKEESFPFLILGGSVRAK